MPEWLSDIQTVHCPSCGKSYHNPDRSDPIAETVRQPCLCGNSFVINEVPYIDWNGHRSLPKGSYTEIKELVILTNALTALIEDIVHMNISYEDAMEQLRECVEDFVKSSIELRRKRDKW